MATSSNLSAKIDSFYEKANKLTVPQRLGICVITIVVIIALFVFYFYLPKKKTIDRLSTQRDSLQRQLQVYKTKASELSKYKKEMEKAKEDFVVASKKLPEENDIPELLSDVSYAARTAGLEINTFKPEKTIPKAFYAEIPISIKAKGSYHQVGLFLDNVSRLSRVVNVNDVKLGMEDISCTAVTYMFVEQETEQTGNKTNANKKKK